MRKKEFDFDFSEGKIPSKNFYGKISLPGEEEEVEFTPQEKIGNHPFVVYCKSVFKIFGSLGKGAKFSDEYTEAVEFLRWDLKAEELTSTISATMIVSLIVFGLLGVILYLFSPVMPFLLGFTKNFYLSVAYLFGPLIGISLGLTFIVQTFPLREAKKEQIQALTYIPEIVGYMIMQMKLVPNLEKATRFAAEHGRGKIARDLGEIVWKVNHGAYSTVVEGLEDLRKRWGSYSSELKEALMNIRASVLEGNEEKRFALLDKTMDSILNSIRDKMENYARGLSQPSTILFYVGILLPLILIIILPVGSSFTGQALARPEILILIYNIALPAFAFIFSLYVISQKPPTYESPKVEDSHPEILSEYNLRNKKYKMVLGEARDKGKLVRKGIVLDVRLIAVLILIAGFGLSYFVSTQGIPPKFLLSGDKGEDIAQIIPADKQVSDVLLRSSLPLDYFEVNGTLFKKLTDKGATVEKAQELMLIEKNNFFFKPENDVSPFLLIFGILITLSLTVSFFLYFSNIYKRKVQQDYMQIESEFKESLYVLASRLGENKPIEEALRHTKEFLPNLKISEALFGKILYNVSVNNLTLRGALFDPQVGALKGNPSSMIRTSMKLLVDSVELSVEQASSTLINLSMQLRNSEKVSKLLTVLVSEISSTMYTMTIFIAPIVLGITTSLQKVVMVTLAQISSAPGGGTGITDALTDLDTSALSSVGAGGVGSAISSIKSLGSSVSGVGVDPTVLRSLADPTQFLVIVAIYVIELVIIMSFFTSMMEEDNKLKFRIGLAKALPVAVIIFIASLYFANTVVGGFFG